MQYLTNPVSVPLSATQDEVTNLICKCVRLGSKDFTYTLYKQSVDARKKNDVHFVCSYVIDTNAKRVANCKVYSPPMDVLRDVTPCCNKRVVVIGAGPSGLFCARYLSASGCKVTVIERGADISKRVETVESYFNGGNFDVNTNVQFGLGGAGTFSDGKLTTGISSPLTYTVFNEFVRCGAPVDITYSATPHIGTDNLRKVVANLRNATGADFLFETTVTDVVTDNGVVSGVVANGKVIECDAVVLAVGHSARDTFAMLNNMGVAMTFKPFAVGVRVEHTRKFVNNAQYGQLFATHRDLPTANYKLAVSVDGRNCYSFCMCPGGVVVSANSEINSVVTNGMSNYLRNADNSNSALVVNVTQEDVMKYGNDCLCGVRFQQELERNCYFDGYRAPCQNVTDFVDGKLTKTFDVTPSYPRGVVSTQLDDCLPRFVTDTLRKALPVFGTKIDGFDKCGVLTAVESRTSCPVRIVRGNNYQSVTHANLYPVGEGAGYAGGIVSASVDGLRVALAIVGNTLNK